MFNPYVDKPEWPACVEIRPHDQNDVPAECVFPRPPRPHEELFREDTAGDFEHELHRLTVENSVRFRVKA